MTDPGGKSVGVPYGPRGMGLVSLTSDGRMMAVLIDGRAKLPDGAKREYSSYCGNYTFDGSTLDHHGRRQPPIRRGSPRSRCARCASRANA